MRRFVCTILALVTVSFASQAQTKTAKTPALKTPVAKASAGYNIPVTFAARKKHLGLFGLLLRQV